MSNDPRTDLYVPAGDVIQGDLIVHNNVVWEAGKIELGEHSPYGNTIWLWPPGDAICGKPHEAYCIGDPAARVRLHSPAPDTRRPGA